MSYEDAIETTISRAQALAEVRRHSCDQGKFLADCGDKAEYTGAEVLGWLGY